MNKEEIIKLAQEAGLIRAGENYTEPARWGVSEITDFYSRVAAAERERICKAIKEEDDYCVTEGDYMLDSNDCIAVAKSEWVRPDYSAGAIRARGEQ
jgi:hypothetical protein